MGSILIIFIFAWSSFWWISTRQLESSVEAWLNNEELEPDLNYKRILTSGYPNRADVTIENFSFNSLEQKLFFSAKLVQILSLVYNQHHLINIVKPPITIKFNNNNLQITGDPIKSSVKIGSQERIVKLISEGGNLILEDQKNNKWNLKQFLMAVENEKQSFPKTLKTHLTIKDLVIPSHYLRPYKKLPQLNRKIETIIFNSNVLLKNQFDTASQNQKEINFNELSIQIESHFITLEIVGNLQFSKEDLINGSLDIKLKNWQNVISAIAKEPLVDSISYKKVIAALTFFGNQRVKKPTNSISFSIHFKENVVFLGPLKIGKIK